MKKLSFIVLMLSLFIAANAQTILTPGPNLTLSNNVLDANLKTVRDSILIAIQKANAAATQGILNTATIKGVQDTGKANMAAIKICQDKEAGLQSQINALTPSSGFFKPIIVTQNYIIADSCHMRTIDVQCNGCIVYFPNNVTPGLKFWINNESIGTIYIKKAITNGAGFQNKYQQSITVGARPVFADYKTSSFVNVR